MPNFESLTEAIAYYKVQGYTIDFNLAFDKVICAQNSVALKPEDFEIVESVRFDGDTDPDEESILYVIQGKDGNHKGTMVSAFGIYADEISRDLLDKLSMHK